LEVIVFRLAVVGSRNLTDYALVISTLTPYLDEHGSSLVIVSGGAKGADSLGALFGRKHNLKVDVYLPEWGKYGKSAGFRRNTTIWDNADAGVAFWDGVSRGTAHSFDIAKAQNKPLQIVTFVAEHMTYVT
jgi:hypothetical protein